MEPQNPQPSYTPPQQPNYPVQPIQPSQMFQPDPPAPRPAKKKWPLLIIIVVLLLGVLAGAWFLMNGKKKNNNTADNSNQTAAAKTDKQAILASVDKYCKELGENNRIMGIKGGYIISDRFTEEQLSDSPGLLRFKQVGDAASATVDCLDSEGPNGISNDLLFIKDNGNWEYKEEVQNGSAKFTCETLEKYNVSKDLAPTCSKVPDSKAQTR